MHEKLQPSLSSLGGIYFRWFATIGIRWETYNPHSTGSFLSDWHFPCTVWLLLVCLFFIVVVFFLFDGTFFSKFILQKCMLHLNTLYILNYTNAGSRILAGQLTMSNQSGVLTGQKLHSLVTWTDDADYYS